MHRLIYSHYFSLPTQGNVYTITNLELANNSNKLLVASLKREIFCFEYLEGPNNQLIPTAREVPFTYIPTGAEIISLDAYNKSTEKNEFVVGITIIKNSGDADNMENYLNIYSGWEATEDFNIENIAQNCQNVELNFIPYGLKHCDLINWENDEITSREKVFLLSGSDNQIHVYREGPDHLFKEMDTKEYFPEFVKFPSVVIWMDLLYISDNTERVIAFGCECGYLRFFKVCVKEKKIVYNFSAKLDNYISHVRLFLSEGLLNMMVICSILTPVIFRDILKYGLGYYTAFPREDESNIFTTCEIADIDLDGKAEILVGNSASEIISYKKIDAKHWDVDEVKEVFSPIFTLKHLDITGDGIKELIVFSMKGVHVFQQDPNYVQKILEEKIENLTDEDFVDIHKKVVNKYH